MSAKTASPSAAKAVDKLSFEDALRELEAIVRQLESGEVELERSIEIYERGALLKAHCEKKLQDAQLKVEKIVLSPGGDVSSASAEME